MNYPNYISLQKIGLLILCLCFYSTSNAQIWPGDANNNGIVNTIDALYVGWAFGSTGNERSIMGTGWQDAGIPNMDWAQEFSDGISYAFADCNGDGVINDLDFEVIIVNYNLEHGQMTSDGYANAGINQGPSLELIPSSDTYIEGNTISIDIALGNRNYPVEAFHGIALEMSYSSVNNTGILEVGYEEDGNSWVNEQASTYELLRHNNDTDKIELVVTRKNGITTGGNGKIGTLYIIIEDIVLNFESDTIQLNIDNVRMIGEDFNTTPVVPASTEFVVLREDPCAFEITYQEQSCSSYTFFSANQEDLDWTINGEYFTYAPALDFNPSSAGTYVICGLLETPDCPQGAEVCQTITVAEDCFYNCDLPIGFDPASCSSFAFFSISQTSAYDWSVNGNPVGLSGPFYDFEAQVAGTYTICAAFETPDCPIGTTSCETITVGADCFDSCVAPNAFSSTMISGSVVRLAWNMTDAERYRIRYRLISGSWTEALTGGSETFRFLNGLQANTTYQYQVKSLCSTYNSIWSATQTIATGADSCDKPETASAQGSGNTATFSWSSNPSDQKYKFKYKVVGSSAGWMPSPIPTITGNSFTATDIVPGITYKYKIKTKCSNGWTDWTSNFNYTAPTFRLAKSETVKGEIQLFPNPVQSSLTIISQKAYSFYRIIDINGQVVQESHTSTASTPIDVSNLESGIYFISFNEEGETITKRFVKQ